MSQEPEETQAYRTALGIAKLTVKTRFNSSINKPGEGRFELMMNWAIEQEYGLSAGDCQKLADAGFHTIEVCFC